MSSQYVERVLRLRNDPKVHYNCAQAVVMAFTPECGLTEEQAMKLCAHFGGGMKMAATCGAITGSLMVIGLMGGGDPEYKAFMAAMRGSHDSKTNCADLLKRSAELGVERKAHCDGMITEAVETVARLMGLA